MRESGYHFVFTLQNIDGLKELVDEIYQDEEGLLFIDAQFSPPYREKEWNPDTGKYEYETEPARLSFELIRSFMTDSGRAFTTYKSIGLDETKEDRGSGMAFPPYFYKEWEEEERRKKNG